MTYSKLAKYTQEKTPAKVQNNFNTNKLIYKIMKTLHQIVIESTTSDEYKTTISILSIEDIVFYEIVKTEHNGVIKEFEQRCDNYKEALKQFLEDVQEYAQHTALMNL